MNSTVSRRLDRMKLDPIRRKIAAWELAALSSRLVDNADLSQPTQLTAVIKDLPKIAPSVANRRLQETIIGELFLGAVGPLAQTGAWVLMRFSTEHEAAALLRAEWETVMPSGGPVDRRAFVDLRYTEAFVREVTRVYPTNARITRTAVVDTSLGGVRVPKHMRVIVNVRALHNDPRFYEEPEKFAPERWLNSRPNAHKFAYVAFGAGGRRCLGDTIAMVTLVAMLPLLARDWDFDFDAGRFSSGGRHQPSEGTYGAVTSRRRNEVAPSA